MAVTLRRPWRPVINPEAPHVVFVMAKRNYKIYGRVGADSNRLVRHLIVLDTGAGLNFIRRSEIPDGLVQYVTQGPLPEIRDANNRLITTLGILRLVVQINGSTNVVEFVVCDRLAAPVILGAAFCDRFVEAIYPRRKEVELVDGTVTAIVRRPLKRLPAAQQIPTGGLDELRDRKQIPKLRVARVTTIKAQSQTWVPVTSDRQGLCVLQPSPDLFMKSSLAMANGVAEMEPNRPFSILVANFARYEQRLVKGQILGTVLPHPLSVISTKITMAEVVGLIEGEDRPGQPSYEHDKVISAVPPHQGKGDPSDAPQASSLDDIDLSHVDEKHRPRLLTMLQKYAKMWDGSLGEINTTEHHIELVPDARPIASHPYRAGPKAREVEQKEVERMLQAGVIEPAQSAWASPVVLVPKPDGSLRFCVDYRKLNAVTVKDTYPIPRMDECIDSLGSATIYTTLDCNSGYWQLPVAKQDQDKTAFVCHAGLFRYKRMPSGLTNAPASFQRTLDILLSRYKWQSCLIYLDDVIIYSNTVDDHFNHVDKILSALNAAGISLKLRKWEFFTDKVKYLGHVIRPGKLEIDRTRIAALEKAQPPKTQSELRL